jgi:hypothetical protein
MRRCVISHIRAPARARNQTRHRNVCLIPRLQMTGAECRMTKERSRRMPWIGEHTRPACWSLRLATTNFSFCLAIRQKFVLSRQQHRHPGRARSPEDRVFTAQSGRSAYRYENRCDHANGTRDYLAWWSVLWRLFRPSQSRPMNCSERS